MNLFFVKEHILKPSYNLMSSLSPVLAFKIRNLLYGSMINFERSTIVDGKIHNVFYLIDTSVINKNLKITGIQRVVLNICRSLPDSYTMGAFYGNKLITNNFLEREVSNPNNVEKEIDINHLKKIVLLDSSWSYKDSFCKIYNKINHDNCKVYAVVYDLIPIKHPHTVVNDAFRLMFINWHNMLLEKADHILCISRAVADDLKSYYEKSDLKREKFLEISYFPLGTDFKPIEEIVNSNVRKELIDFLVHKKTFLMVGTIEPRKGYITVLKAFTKLLEEGNDIKLIILGRDGWKNNDFREFLRRSKYNGKNILWLNDATDSELSWAYQNSSALIAASLDEGYGLPLIEGAHYGIPIICSDIPVFREVSQGYADYFKVLDSEDLVSVIKRWLAAEKHPDSKQIKAYTWKEATRIFFDIIEGSREPYKVLLPKE